MNDQRKSLLISDLMLLAVAVVWGTSYGVVKSALVFYPVLGLLALRFTLTFVILSPALRQLAGLSLRQYLGLLSTGLLLLGIFLSETFGLLHTTATNAAFLISLCVMLTPLVEWAWLKRRPTRLEWLAVGISMVGAALMALHGQFGVNVGDALILLAAVCRAVQVCLIKRVVQSSQIPALAVTALQSGVVALGCMLLAFITLPAPVESLAKVADPVAFWGYMAYLVLACTLFAFFAQNYAIKRSNPTRVSLLMGSEPLFGGLFAVLWLNESVTVQGWIGGGLIFVSCVLASRKWSFWRLKAAASVA
ncbi:DMT family transporter [Pseudomonas sp.]|uniref:DMT family transporter n=1 Tax=Pseudomonas sp. TaxID=306 RepID=UPI0028AE8A69|nr:DMT family transporter [Pseudomonas sp.]